MLLQALQRRDPAAIVWHTAACGWTAGAAVARVQQLRDAWHAARGGVVAVQLREPLGCVQALVALHGVAATLVLMPAAISAAQTADVVQRAGAQWLVSDADPGIDGCRWLSHADAAPQDSPGVAGETPTTWLLGTSGTTGAPKLVAHTLPALSASVQCSSDGAAHRWGLLVDPVRFAGLQVVLQSLLGGSSLTLADANMSLAAQLALFAKTGVNALSASPTLWRKLLMAGAALPLRTITLGGEVADQKILHALSERFPQARVRHVYASTEAGVGFSVGDGAEGFPAAWLQTPPPGVELRIASDAGDGELLLRSARAASGYHGGAALHDADGWVASGDRVHSDGARVRFVGRINGSINIGGDKVHPETVEGVLLAHPDVFAASVRARHSAFTGALVEALVVPAAASVADASLKQALLAHCRDALPRHAVPALLRFVAQIDVDASGKQDRRA